MEREEIIETVLKATAEKGVTEDMIMDVVEDIEAIKEFKDDPKVLSKMLNVCKNHIARVLRIVIEDLEVRNLAFIVLEDIESLIKIAAIDKDEIKACEMEEKLEKDGNSLLEKLPELAQFVA